MIATEMAARYAKGEAINSLARRYGISWDRAASILAHMDAAGPRCKRCEILLAQAPKGDAGLCGWCESEER